MEKYIEQNGISYELRGSNIIPCLNFPDKRRLASTEDCTSNISKRIARDTTLRFLWKVLSNGDGRGVTQKKRR